MTDDPHAVPGERVVSEVAGRRVFTRTHWLIVILGSGALALGVIAWRANAPKPNPNEARERDLRVRQTAQYEPAPAPPAPLPMPDMQKVLFRPPQSTPVPAAAPVVPQPAVVRPGPAAEDPLVKARHAGLLTYGSPGSASAAAAAGSAGAPLGADGRPSEMSLRLQPTRLSAVSAAVLPHQPFLLTKGHSFPCVLQTAIDSTLPGFVTCRLPEDVLGKTGITLLDRGTLLFMESRGDLRQGQQRLFILAERAETPNGVVINLDSPVTDPVGRSGVEGDVDDHFWQRFKGALLLSLVQGAVQIASSSVAGTGSTNLNFGGPEGAITEALRNSVNIVPSLKLPQGATINIMVARDLDFASVYSVSTRR